MTRRLFILFLVFVLTIPLMTVPAYATGSYDQDIYETTVTISGLLDIIGYKMNEWFDAVTDYQMKTYDFLIDFRDMLWTVLYSHTASLEARLIEIRDNFLGWTNWFSTFTNDVLPTYFSDLGDRFVAQFDRIVAQFDRLILGTEDQQGDADDFESDVNSQETQFQEFEDIISTSPTINIDDVEDFYNEGVTAEIDGNYKTILASIVQHEFVGTILLYSFLFGLSGFVLYGKRF